MTRLACIGLAVLLVPALGASAPVPPGPDDELHVVALYQGNTKTGDMLHGGKASLKVDRPSKNVTLVVSAYHSITWDITLTPKTKLEKVILTGYERQAANAPGGVEVVKYYRESREMLDYAHFHYNIEGGRFRSSVQELFRFTEREIASFQGMNTFDPKKPIVVDAHQKDERLLSDFPKVEPAKNLPKIKFQAVRSVPDRFGASYSFGDFTAAGPENDSLAPLPKGINRIAFDLTGKKYYGMDAHNVYEVDLEKAKSTKMDPGLNVPRMSWMGGITYDTKRERLLVATFGGGGILYSYTPKTGVWAALSELKGAVSAGMAYHPADDTIYAFKFELGDERATTLSKINAQGAVVKTVEVGAPMFPGVIGRGPNQTQLVSMGDHIAILIQTERRGSESREKLESFLFILDPKTDKVKLAWKESR